MSQVVHQLGTLQPTLESNHLVALCVDGCLPTAQPGDDMSSAVDSVPKSRQMEPFLCPSSASSTCWRRVARSESPCSTSDSQSRARGWMVFCSVLRRKSLIRTVRLAQGQNKGHSGEGWGMLSFHPATHFLRTHQEPILNIFVLHFHSHQQLKLSRRGTAIVFYLANATGRDSVLLPFALAQLLFLFFYFCFCAFYSECSDDRWMRRRGKG